MGVYYVAMAIDVDGYGQSDYLCLIKVEGGAVIGYAAEFDACTEDVDMACDVARTHQAKWFAWRDEWETRPAALGEIKLANLDGYVIGIKRNMRLSTPVEPLLL